MSLLVPIYDQLAHRVDALRFGTPVAYVYNPLRYAWARHEDYLRRYGAGRPEVVLVGMNPGPFGMTQTGVPFGEVGLVRDWLRIEGPVDRPEKEHSKRPVEGFRCTRSEVSGTRLWGWARDRFQTPERFFSRFLVLNYCPLVFLEESGRNRTPDKLPKAEAHPLFAACDEAFVAAIDVLSPKLVVGVGAWAKQRAGLALADRGIRVGQVLHPSPASPRANQGWATQAEAELRALGVDLD